MNDMRRGTYRVPGDERVYVLPGDIKALDAAWDAYLGTRTAPDTLDPDHRGEADMSPEAVEERARLKARHAEAVSFISGYTGTFGLILDIRANPKWGTKYLRLSPRQVDAVLASRDRDAARLSAPRHPRYDEAIAALERAGSFPNTSDFALSLIRQVMSGRTLSDRQVEAVLRGSTGSPAPSRESIADGMYLVDDVPWKVQWNREKTHLYAKRLRIEDGDGTFDFVSGGLSIVAAKGVPMTAEQAAAFGHLYGVCAVCGARLTDEVSIARGIGPICASKLA